MGSVKRVILIVMDSVGCGELPDAAKYGDHGSNTLGNLAKRVGGMKLPNLERLGLGHLTEILGVGRPRGDGAFGKMNEASQGKDTTTGHWEIAGLRIDDAFTTYPDGFPAEILEPFIKKTGRGVIGNKVASGTEILKELGELHMKTGDLIVYTSADSVFQVAAHESVIPVDELHRYCRIAREILDEHRVGRVIARPFVGTTSADFKRTYNRRDFAMLPPRATVLDTAKDAGLPVVAIGKIEDIYAAQGVTKGLHTEGNADGLEVHLREMAETTSGIVFNNLVDFDMLYGHRRDPDGYYGCLRELDAWLPKLEAKLREGDLVMITADHGNDPTAPGTDHTREYVPLLVFGPACRAGVDLGVRQTFADVGATVANALGLAAPPHGKSFLADIS